MNITFKVSRLKFLFGMETSSKQSSLFDTEGNVVYISDDWKCGESVSIRLPFHVLCIHCKAVKLAGDEVTMVCKQDAQQRKEEQFRCEKCKRSISLVFDDLEELSRVKGGRVIKDTSETLSSEELCDSDTSEEEDRKEDGNLKPALADPTAKSSKDKPTVFVLNGIRVNTRPAKRRVHSKKHIAKYSVS